MPSSFGSLSGKEMMSGTTYIAEYVTSKIGNPGIKQLELNKPRMRMSVSKDCNFSLYPPTIDDLGISSPSTSLHSCIS